MNLQRNSGQYMGEFDTFWARMLPEDQVDFFNFDTTTSNFSHRTHEAPITSEANPLPVRMRLLHGFNGSLDLIGFAKIRSARSAADMSGQQFSHLDNF